MVVRTGELGLPNRIIPTVAGPRHGYFCRKARRLNQDATSAS